VIFPSLSASEQVQITDLWAIEFHPNANIDTQKFARKYNLLYRGKVGAFDNVHLFQLDPNATNHSTGENSNHIPITHDNRINDVEELLHSSHSKFFNLLNSLKHKHRTIDNSNEQTNEENIIWFERQTLRRRERRGFLVDSHHENDNTIQIPPKDPLYPLQWHLHGNITGSAVNVNILQVWRQGFLHSFLTTSLSFSNRLIYINISFFFCLFCLRNDFERIVQELREEVLPLQ
jgi:hypothetical protein